MLQPALESDKVAAEDRRYSIVSIDNFNYYEVEVSTAGYGITVEFTLAYGTLLGVQNHGRVRALF